jgi:hypothetical protein
LAAFLTATPAGSSLIRSAFSHAFAGIVDRYTNAILHVLYVQQASSAGPVVPTPTISREKRKF